MRGATIFLYSLGGFLASTAVYLGIGALAHHVLVAAYFDPYRMMSWGALLGWPIIFSYVMILFMMFIGGAIMAIMGLSEKEYWISGIGAVLLGLAWFGWRLFF
jgi:hypothetical protein